MKVLISGGAGFIGSRLVAHHLARGDQVFAFDDLSTGNLANISAHASNPGLQFQQADIASWPGLEPAIQGMDRIYHMAAVVGMFHVLKHPVDVIRVNVLGCERILAGAAAGGRHPQIVIASSSSVYGACPTEQMREDADVALNPSSPLLNYALSKYTNEAQAKAYALQCGLPIVVARLFNTVGQGQSGAYGFVVPRFVEQALAEKPLSVFGDGLQTRSFCDVRDTVAMLDELAGTDAAHGQVVNVGNDAEISIEQLARLVCECTGSASRLQHIPYAEAYGQVFAQIDQRRPHLDKLRRLIDYRPQWKLSDTIDGMVGQRRGH